MMFKILVKNLVLFGFHGVNESEKKKGQYFIYNLKIKLKESYALKEDSIKNTVNYSEAIRLLKKINSEKRFDLLETLAFACASELIMMSDLIEEVKITIEKPKPPIKEKLGSVGVSCKLKRKDFLKSSDEKDSESNMADIAENRSRTCFLSLGTNIGNRLDNLRRAVSLLSGKNILKISKSSSIYETEPMYFKEQPAFYNLVLQAEVKTETSPFVLLGYLKEIEYEMGRQSNTSGNSPRIIDIDLIDIENIVIESDILKLPHPGMKERNFVLIPMSEIAPAYKINGISIKEYINKCNFQESVTRIRENILII
jgi:dihydroneopterin aldolase/2-amino-4-hydroxy-6-hydroxymethyldihydropteridine diphosphokinase